MPSTPLARATSMSECPSGAFWMTRSVPFASINVTVVIPYPIMIHVWRQNIESRRELLEYRGYDAALPGHPRRSMENVFMAPDPYALDQEQINRIYMTSVGHLLFDLWN